MRKKDILPFFIKFIIYGFCAVAANDLVMQIKLCRYFNSDFHLVKYVSNWENRYLIDKAINLIINKLFKT